MKALAGPALLLFTTMAVFPVAARQDEPVPVFKAESELVVLHVNVLDGRSDAVANLPEHVFQIAEDDQPQRITFFSSLDVPVAVGLVVDNSGSMITRRPMVLAGVKAFAESSHPEDEVFTIVFNEHVRNGLPSSQAFTQSPSQIEAAVTRFAPGGKTALHDAVIEGIGHLQSASHQKHVLVVLSDGDDNASMNSADVMLQRAARSNVLIYTISTAELGSSDGNSGLLKKLAQRSGGATYAPRTELAVVEAFREIAGNIRRGYSIGYVPTNTVHDGRYRRVKVSVRAPGYRNLSVIARDGYLAAHHTDAH
jgi:Ca-activated chloride channel homolog